MPPTQIALQFQRWTTVSSLALLAVTWRLWTPQSEFPQIPFFKWLCSAPGWIDWFSVSSLCVALSGLAITATIRLRSQPVRLRSETKSGTSELRWHSAISIETLLLLVVLSSLITLIGLNQHRLQPWAYELGIVAVVWLGIRSDTRRLAWMRWVIVSIYCYSALGKFDFEFLHTVGQHMLTALLKIGGVDSRQLSEPVRVAIAATFPVYELFIAVGLAFPRTRRLAGIAAIILHAGLIVILGPLGLNHRTGVLVWNVQVAVQTYWMFVAGRGPRLAPSAHGPQLAPPAHGPRLAPSAHSPQLEPTGRGPQLAPTGRGPRLAPSAHITTENAKEQAVAPTQMKSIPQAIVQSDAPEIDNTHATSSWPERVCAAILFAVIVLPASERLGWWDHWPSWALYAPHSSRVRVEVLPMAVGKLPPSLRAVIANQRQTNGENTPEDFTWVPLPIEAWSLKTLDSPIYPQARFQLGIAAAIAKSLDSEFGIRVTVLGPAARLDGERSESLLDSRSAILNSGSKFWVNTENRPFFELNIRNGSGTVP